MSRSLFWWQWRRSVINDAAELFETFCHIRRLESESWRRFGWWQFNSRPVLRLYRRRLQQRRCKCDRNCKTIIFCKELFFLKHSICRNAQALAWNPEVSIHLLVFIIMATQLRLSQLYISVMSDNGEQAAIQLCYPKLIENGTCPRVYLEELSASGYTVKMCSTCRSDFCNRFAPHENSDEHFF